MRLTYGKYSLREGLRKYPTRTLFAARGFQRGGIAVIALLLILCVCLSTPSPLGGARKTGNIQSVPGENYQICNEQSTYLTSPYTYDALPSGQQTYTINQYKELNTDGSETGNPNVNGSAYGTAIPALPSYIANQPNPATTTAAEIFAPGSSDISAAAYNFPETPIIYFFEGGSYGPIGLQSVSGDMFMGGSAPGYPEPVFNDANQAGGISAQNDSYSYSGNSTTVSSNASIGATTIQTSGTIANYASWLTFADGTTYQIASSTSNSVTLDTSITNAESSGTQLWVNSAAPIGYVASSAAQGAASVTLGASTLPIVQWENIAIGSDNYILSAVSGSQSGYTLTTRDRGLDTAVGAGTPVYYSNYSGGVSVEYLEISHDLHTTTGTITIGQGWTVEHNNIHDGYRNPGEGVALYGGDESTIEYNCLARMGDYGGGGSGDNEVFDYNEILQTAYEADPGCGCSGGGKWWGTLNADIVDNAFVENGIGGDQSAIWLDNGNTGTKIEGNYFYKDASQSLTNETGFNMLVDDNLFLDDGWGSGNGGCGSNCDGAININSSGGMNIPGSRYENSIQISNNYFVNDWQGIDIWQSTQRSCLGSGEGWPLDAAYCSGGFPTTDTTAANGQYYFSHESDTNRGGTTTVAQSTNSGSTTLMVKGPEAINDYVGFADEATATTTTTGGNSATLSNAKLQVNSISGWPTTGGQMRADTSAAGGGGGLTGAVLSYTGVGTTTGTCGGSSTACFTGVTFERGEGTISGPLSQIQPYKVTSETCYSNDCALTITPALTSNVSAGTEVASSGTCAIYAIDTATPTSPLAPNGTSYWDGCQWESRNVSVTSNTFVFQPSQIANSAPPVGSATTTTCSATNTDNCGTNFMAFQSGGTLPYVDQTGGNAMMSSSTFTGCPGWDSGCNPSQDPLTNLNALSNAPGVAPNNGEAAYNNVWSNNSYSGPWMVADAYSYSGCNPLPTDPNTNKTMPNGDCGAISIPTWESAWQQDSGSTYNPLAVSLYGLTTNQEVHGNQTVSAYEDTVSPNTLNSTLAVNGTTTGSSLTTSPFNFALNTLNYHDGLYTLQVNASDNGGNSSNDSVPVYIANGDLNGDGNVNISDLAIMAGHWGQTDGNYTDGNITGQSTINISDLAVMASNWGTTGL